MADASTAGPSCQRRAPGTGAARLGAGRASSAVALARASDGRTLAYVADADATTLHTVDVDAGREIAVTELGARPEHVLVLADGRVATTLRRDGRVVVLEPTAAADAPLQVLCAAPVAAEPVALATTPDDGTLLVTSAWGHTVTLLDAQTFARRREHEVPREPRAVLVSDDGRRAYVSHAMGGLVSVIDLDSEKAPRSLSLSSRVATPGASSRHGCQGYALAKAVEVPSDGKAPLPPAVEQPPIAPKVALAPAPARPQPAPVPRARIFVPQVTVNPGALGQFSYYGATDGLPTEAPQVSVLDGAAERVLGRGVGARAVSAKSELPDCLLPRAAAVSGTSLFVACQGIDALVEYDARAVDPARAELRRFPVGAGPTGLAVDEAGQRAIVFAQFDRAVSVAPLAGGAPRTVTLSRRSGTGLAGEVARGRALFHRTGDTRISVEGMACASCHPEGRDDSIVWSTIEGMRNTPMLGGRMRDAAPYAWSGAHATVEIHLADTITRLRGTGLPPGDVAAIAAYVREMEGPPVAPARLSPDRATVAAQGKELFASTGCTSCHGADRGFADGQRHDVRPVALRAAEPEERIKTPPLRFLSGTAPYFHDGRYATLDDMLTATDHAMGATASLTREQRAALVAYLETL